MDISAAFARYDKQTDVGICVYDRGGHYIYINDTFLKIRKVSREEYMGLTPYDLYNNNLTDKCVMDAVRKNRATTTDVQTVFSKDGKTVLRKHLVTLRPFFDEAGEIEYYVGYYKDLESFNEEYDDKTAPRHINTDERGFRTMIEKEAEEVPFVAVSENMKALCRAARQVADTDSTVLLTGETGTGKEVFASYLHNISKRKAHNFVVVDCTSLPESLMESELFGYEKGTFTGGLSTGKKGLIESADGGTLFLDEINSLPLTLQAKLLRLIETKSIKKLGSVKPQEVDFRLIATTNVDLVKCVEEKTFRSDLYYRLNILPFYLPPLRERKDDIRPLVNRFLKEFQEQYGIRRELSENVYQEMLEYDWPGNVRELRNFIERSVLMGATALEPRVAPPPEPERKVFALGGTASEDEEKERILAALAANGNHRERTARALNISRRTLQYKLKKYHIT